ncbi:LysR family transcriptional regulator [Vineibacter terrae]|uniref:LysR family transcriptional regulator n=1 Tax=Vineibacter terrae TaxID=2586908 RepID=UPI002E2EB80D|nr:LysR family transcriptional regulator [Vineibacter terrae]HEX2890051.1 LysR family transcriptional regulator [Vineibacter terrae]
MDAKQLRYFVRIVETGSISRAAADLRVAQSALSLHIANLEDELGVLLLVRKKRGVTPTECGELLFNRARSILGQFESAVQEIRSYAANPAGNVTLGLPASIAAFFAAPLLMQLKNRYPSITLRIVDGVPSRLLAEVQESRIDLALVAEAGANSTLGVERLLSEKLYLVGAGRRRFGNAPAVKTARLASLPLVLPGRDHGIRLLIEEVAAKLGIELTVNFQVDAVTAIKDLVRLEFGVTVLPGAAVRDEIKRGEFWAVELVNPTPLRNIVLVRPVKPPPTRASDAARSVIRDLIVKLVNDGDWPATLLFTPTSEPYLFVESVDWL